MVTRWLVVVILAFPLAASAEDPAQEAYRLYTDMKYSQALKLVNQVLRSPKALPQQIKTAYQTQGLCFAVRGKSKQAVGAFRRLLALDPAHKLPSSVSPKFRPLFVKAQNLSAGKAGLVLSHQLPGPPKALAGLALKVDLKANPFKLAQAVRLLYWTPGGKRQWSGVKVKRAGALIVKLPGTLNASEIDYYFEATNKFGGVLVQAGSRDKPFKLKSAAAPLAVAPLVVPKKPLVTKVEIPDVTKTAVLPPAKETRPVKEDENGAAAWYQTWWFWTSVGVVVAGVATGVALGVTADSPSGDIEYRIYLR